jgi:hypothetical protein
MLESDGKRKIEWKGENNEVGALSFDTVVDFLENGGKLITNSWKMEEK